MSPAAHLPLTIVADDLTGACDTGALFAARGPVPVTVWPDPPLRAPVSVVDTESRALNPVDAARRVSGVARNLARTRFFKKIDSTLRGPIGAELDALLRATSSPGALVCPTLPAERRVVVERVLLVGAQPVAETPIAEDPTFPRAAGTSNVVDLLRPQLDRPFAWIPLGRVREGGSPLAARLVRLAGMVIVADAETDADLDALIEAVLELDAPPLLVGAAGLALALARRLGLATARRPTAPAPSPSWPRRRAPGSTPSASMSRSSPAARRSSPSITRSAPSVWTSRAPRVPGWRSAGCAHRAASRWPSSPRPAASASRTSSSASCGRPWHETADPGRDDGRSRRRGPRDHRARRCRARRAPRQPPRRDRRGVGHERGAGAGRLAPQPARREARGRLPLGRRHAGGPRPRQRGHGLAAARGRERRRRQGGLRLRRARGGAGAGARDPRHRDGAHQQGGAGGGRHAAHRHHRDPRAAVEHRRLRDAADGQRAARDPRHHARGAAPRAGSGDARARAEDDPARARDDARPRPSRRAHRGGGIETARGRGRALRRRGEDGDRARHRGRARRGPARDRSAARRHPVLACARRRI